MTHDEHHGNGPKQSAPTPGDHRQGNGAYDNSSRECARRQRGHICAVGQEHARPGHDNCITRCASNRAAGQPGHSAQRNRQRRRGELCHRFEQQSRRLQHQRQEGQQSRQEARQGDNNRTGEPNSRPAGRFHGAGDQGLVVRVSHQVTRSYLPSQPLPAEGLCFVQIAG